MEIRKTAYDELMSLFGYFIGPAKEDMKTCNVDVCILIYQMTNAIEQWDLLLTNLVRNVVARMEIQDYNSASKKKDNIHVYSGIQVIYIELINYLPINNLLYEFS